MTFSFSKYAGCGNDFIFIDNRHLFFPLDKPLLVSRLCHRQRGVGGDGLILLENSSQADFKMRIFNADGREAEMCGNGMRCLFKFIEECIGKKQLSYVIETMCSLIKMWACDEEVIVEMAKPKELRWNLSIPYSLVPLPLHFLNTGVPHLVLFVDDVEAIDLLSLGRELRFHKAFAPRGANVNIVSLGSEGMLFARTYERGVEGETLACGTGATAAALAAAHIKGWRSPIVVYPRSKEKLEIGFSTVAGGFSQVTMKGAATLIFKGEARI